MEAYMKRMYEIDLELLVLNFQCLNLNQFILIGCCMAAIFVNQMLPISLELLLNCFTEFDNRNIIVTYQVFARLCQIVLVLSSYCFLVINCFCIFDCFEN